MNPLELRLIQAHVGLVESALRLGELPYTITLDSPERQRARARATAAGYGSIRDWLDAVALNLIPDHRVRTTNGTVDGFVLGCLITIAITAIAHAAGWL